MSLSFLENLEPKQLLQVTGAVIDELKRRGINRTGNNPLSDYAEWLVEGRLGLKLAPKSMKGFDATDPKTQLKYEIKARRVTPGNSSRQLSALRDLDKKPFDFLIAVVFSKDFDVKLALKIPIKVVKERAKRVDYTNSYKLEAKDSLKNVSGVEDITSLLG